MVTKVKAEQPISAARFAGLWKNPGKEAIFDGNAEIPNVYIRQNRLIGQVLDACIILHVYEEIKRGASFQSLEFLLPNKFDETKFATLKALPDKQKLQKLVGMANEEQKPENRLRHHRLLIVPEDWENYKAEYRNAQKESPDNLPEDPRITVINKIIAPTIKLLNCGHKTTKATEAKAKRGERDICELRDINRIGVLPTEVEYAKDFIQVIKLLNPDKKVGKTKIPRFYEEAPEVLRNGYFNQKLFVVQDRRFGRDVTKDNTATIAEIKIVPAEMLYAEKLSAATKQVVNLLDSKIKYISDDPDDAKEIKNNRDNLKTEYNKQKEKFEKLVSGTNKKYKWPKFDADKAKSQEAYDNLRNDLTYLSIQIHVDAMMEADRTWKEEYLRTVMRKELGASQSRPTNIPDIMGQDHDGNIWVEKVAISSGIDLDYIRGGIFGEKWIEKAAKQAQERQAPKQAHAHR